MRSRIIRRIPGKPYFSRRSEPNQVWGPRKGIAKRITRRLSLTAEQAAKVRDTLIARQKALLAIRREVHSRVEAEPAKDREQVAAILDPEEAKS